MNTTMDDDLLNESLSAVADGRATAADWARVEAAWAHDAGLRERWALWHAAGDGLRSADLPALHREPQALLDGLHARMSALAAPLPPRPRRRDWLAPAAVAASFVAMAVGWSTLRWPSPAGGDLMALATLAPATAAPRTQALVGTSFAQAAAGRAWPGAATLQVVDSHPEIAEWPQGPALPDAAGPAARP
ncbi:MAG: hypothetical protein QM788_02855 [Roseateles sp.]|uniref:RseA family anti-sigma factor n=1 Tax=Roseateles sp. TaxID=1971397 RepID=UPI0039ED08A6